jgi:hypothetical protein
VCGVFVRDKPPARLAQAFVTQARQFMQSLVQPGGPAASSAAEDAG